MRSVRWVSRSRSRLRQSPRSGASSRSGVAPGAGYDKEAGGPRQSAHSVCLPTARSSASCLRGRAERPPVLRSRSRPQRPRTGSPNVVRSAGTGQRESTACWRDGPVAAQRSSGASRRQRRASAGPPFRALPSEARSRRVRGSTGRKKPEVRGGLDAQHESADGPEAHRGALGGGREAARIACGGGAKCCPAGGRSRGAGVGWLAGRLPRVTGHGCAAGHVLCEAVQAA